MKIYTKTGDQGQTSLWGGGRVAKTHPRVAAYGTLDEANSAIGLAITFLPSKEKLLVDRLIRVQHELFQLGSELATQPGAKAACALIGEKEIQGLETEIDDMETVLDPLKNFILPGGSSAGATLHLARTVVRRVERQCVDLAHSEEVRQEVIQYLNRLSDYLFVSARHVNHVLKQPETKWTAPKP